VKRSANATTMTAQATWNVSSACVWLWPVASYLCPRVGLKWTGLDWIGLDSGGLDLGRGGAADTLIHSSIHSYISSLIHPFIHSFYLSFFHPSIHSSIHAHAELRGGVAENRWCLRRIRAGNCKGRDDYPCSQPTHNNGTILVDGTTPVV
jgi:hypothetical protein